MATLKRLDNSTDFPALTGLNTAAGDLILIWDASAGAYKSITRDELWKSARSLLVSDGTTSAITDADSGFSVYPYVDDGTHSFAQLVNYGGSSGYGEGFYCAYARGTPAAPAVSQSGDWIGGLEGVVYDGANFPYTATVDFYVDAAPGAHVPGRISLSTASAAAGALERLRLDSAGAVFVPTIGTTASAANAFLNSGSTPANSLLRSTSSLAYKTDVEPLDSARADNVVENLAPIWYRSLAPADNPAFSFYGLGAEDVAQVEPRLVHWGYKDSDWYEVEIQTHKGTRVDRRLREGAELAPDGVMYDRVVVMLLDVVRRQGERIAALEAAAGLVVRR
jgi:hypothetical protein